MPTPIRMPDIGTVQGDVLLTRWLKREGEGVVFGEPLLEVETDKGVNEVEAVATGVLLRRMAVEGSRVAAGDVIAWIGAAGEAVPGQSAGPEAQRSAPAGAQADGGAAGLGTGSAARRAAAHTARAGRIPPSLRLLANRRGVNLAAVRGTGPGGALTREDVLHARPGTEAAADNAASGSVGRSRLTGSQALVARKVARSWAEKPVYHVSVQADMSRVQAFRAANTVSYDAIFVRALGMAVTGFPVFRAHLEGSEIVEASEVAVALSVSVEEDLYAPVVRGAGSRSAVEISREIDALVDKARRRALTAADVEGGCILVSNLGMLPVESFDAIIYPDHSAALAVGAALPTPVAMGQEIRVVPLARLTLSVDHRLINGKAAASFLARVKEILETGAYE
jgi:pyruvate dehydrogenase E2 component (dihydrolipoyllysine-residue acetyltransferase)